MSLGARALLTVVLALELGCGDHYEGGGRRRELPRSAEAEPPTIGPGDASSASGGASAAEEGTGGAANAGTAPVPQAGSG